MGQLGAISQCDSVSLRRIASRYYPRRPNATMENASLASRSSDLVLSLSFGRCCRGRTNHVTIYHLNVTRSCLRLLFLIYAAKSRPYVNALTCIVASSFPPTFSLRNTKRNVAHKAIISTRITFPSLAN